MKYQSKLLGDKMLTVYYFIFLNSKHAKPHPSVLQSGIKENHETARNYQQNQSGIKNDNNINETNKL